MCFPGGKCFPEETVDRCQRDRQRIDLRSGIDLHVMYIIIERAKLIYVVPNSFIRGVEYMGTVPMDLDTGMLINVRSTISSDVAAFLNDDTFNAVKCQPFGNDHAEQSGSDYVYGGCCLHFLLLRL